MGASFWDQKVGKSWAWKQTLSFLSLLPFYGALFLQERLQERPSLYWLPLASQCRPFSRDQGHRLRDYSYRSLKLLDWNRLDLNKVILPRMNQLILIITSNMPGLTKLCTARNYYWWDQQSGHCRPSRKKGIQWTTTQMEGDNWYTEMQGIVMRVLNQRVPDIVCEIACSS